MVAFQCGSAISKPCDLKSLIKCHIVYLSFHNPETTNTVMKTLSLILLFLCGFVFSADKLTIAKDGRTAYRIVLPENAAPVLHTAAKELSEHLNKITGASFPIVDEKDYREGPAFFIGPVAAAKAVFADAEFSNAKPDTTVVSFRGDDVFLSGAPSSGPL